MPNTPTTQELSLQDVIKKTQRFKKFLFSNWLAISLFGLIGGVAGVAYAWLYTPKYEAVITFATDNSDNSSSGGIMGIAAQFGFSLGGGSDVFTADNIPVFLQSQKIIKSALLSKAIVNNQKQTLLNIYLQSTGMDDDFKKSEKLKNLSFPVDQPESSFSRLQDSVLLLVITDIQKNNVSAFQPDKKTEVYELDCTSEDEFFSKAFAEELIKEVSDFYIETKTKRSQQTVDILQYRADSIRHAFTLALSGKAELTDANLNFAFQTPAVDIQDKETDLTVLATAYAEIVKDLELAKFNLLRATPLVQVVDTPLLPLKKIKPGRLLAGIIGAFFFAFIGVLYLLMKRAIAKAK
jgi:uncharacterized protein involved in exopolysaccharide biosynthesis